MAVFPEEVCHTVTLRIRIITQIMFWKVIAAERDATYKCVILDGIFLSAKELQYFCLFVCFVCLTGFYGSKKYRPTPLSGITFLSF